MHAYVCVCLEYRVRIHGPLNGGLAQRLTVVCDRWWKTASAEERYSNLILENVKRVSGQSKASCREKDKERKEKN